jgi:type II secretory pathway component PulF
LLGPLMIVVMGVLAGSVALCILLPLMRISEFVQ